MCMEGRSRYGKLETPEVDQLEAQPNEIKTELAKCEAKLRTDLNTIEATLRLVLKEQEATELLPIKVQLNELVENTTRIKY